jgi:hypothetical protein
MTEHDKPGPMGFPASDAMAALTATLAMADSIGASLATTRGLLLAGRRVDLSGLNDLCGRLCARSLDLPPEQGRMLSPRLRMLRDGLDVTTRMLSGEPEKLA